MQPSGYSRMVLGMAAAGALFISTAHGQLSKADERFVAAAASGGMLEVQLGEYAARYAGSAKVQSLGRQMANDHRKIIAELRSSATNRTVNIPMSMTEGDRYILQRLEKLKGAAFDRAYVSQMVTDHQNDIAYFDIEAADGSDSAMRDFARKALSTLRQDLKIAEKQNSGSGY